LTAGLNGLNWQVQVWPCVLAIVSEPPCLCEALSVLLPSRALVPLPLSADVDVGVVDPLQAAASRVTGRATAANVMRLGFIAAP
jgi:hypothetical protein